MENEFEGIDTSRVRFTITPNFRFDSVKKEVEWGPHKAETEQRMYAFATNSSRERSLLECPPRNGRCSIGTTTAASIGSTKARSWSEPHCLVIGP